MCPWSQKNSIIATINDMIFTNKLSCEHRPCLFLHLLLHLGVNLFVDEAWIWVSTLVLVSEFID